MTVTREDLEVSLALAALGIADADEQAWIDHVAMRDPTFAQRLRDLCDTAACLTLALPLARPPPPDAN